jgi:probable F420-dependent oxidoreductase
MKFGLLGVGVNPKFWIQLAQEAETLGFESFWLPEHLVLPVGGTGSPIDGEHPPIPPEMPVFDALVFLAAIAARTSRIRLGTHVYNISLRHPFVTARAVATLDIISDGRVDLGVGVSWNPQEVAAAGFDFASRGRRAQEVIDVCQRLWSDKVVEHHGEFFDFPPVMFEPKPVQKPWPRIHMGGNAPIALKRAALMCDGWCPPSTSTLEKLPRDIALIQQLRAEAGRTGPFEVSVTAVINSHDDIKRYADAGVDRLLVRPFAQSREAFDGIRRFADSFELPSTAHA